ncbi:MAG: hypothetical protein KGJ90_06570 [Patescibacteria group bacterium]|nr:hypothetical protein [Patescibacteria group bacterium]
MEEVKSTDLKIEPEQIRFEPKDKTGYPYGLAEEQIIKMIYFFGGRKLMFKAKGHAAMTKDFTTDELSMVKEMMGWFRIKMWENGQQRRDNYREIVLRFKVTCDFLKRRPAFVTYEMYKALEQGGYKSVIQGIVWVMNEDGKLVPRAPARGITPQGDKKTTPFNDMEGLFWEIQGVGLDKIKMIMDSITVKDVQKANLGMKSKAIRDLYSMIHMARISNKNPNMTLVNMNINTAAPEDKLKAFTNWSGRNRAEKA